MKHAKRTRYERSEGLPSSAEVQGNTEGSQSKAQVCDQLVEKSGLGQPRCLITGVGDSYFNSLFSGCPDCILTVDVDHRGLR